MRITCPGALALLSCAAPVAAAPTPWRLPETVLLATLSGHAFGDSARAPRFRNFGRTPAGQSTPQVDQLFSDRNTATHNARRRSYQAELGVVSFDVEALRLQPPTSDRLGATGSPGKSWAVGVGSAVRLGDADRLSLGMAAGTYRARLVTGMVTDPSGATSLAQVDLGWARGDQWRFGVGWRQAGGKSRSAVDRLVAIANGTPMHEHGMRLSVAFHPDGVNDPSQKNIGVEMRRATISLADLAILGAAPQQDMQGKIYFRTHF